MLIMFFIQRHFIRTHNASLAEYLYGVKRVDVKQLSSIASSPKRSVVSDISINVALFCLVGIPYIARKLDEYFAVEAIAVRTLDSSSSEPTSVERRRRVTVLKAYLALKSSVVSLRVLFKLLYSLGKTEYFTPRLAYARTTLRRITADDVRRHRERVALSDAWEKNGDGSLLSSSRVSWVFQKLVGALQTGFVFSAVLFKFVEWWHSPANAGARERAMRQMRTSASTPPPPPSCPSGVRPLQGRGQNGRCELCGRTRRNPAASSSGAVFCYACIFGYVREHGTCPATGMPCKTNQIRRLR